MTFHCLTVLCIPTAGHVNYISLPTFVMIFFLAYFLYLSFLLDHSGSDTISIYYMYYSSSHKFIHIKMNRICKEEFEMTVFFEDPRVITTINHMVNL